MILAADTTAIDLARFQFAFTISAHIFFPAFSIGLASYLAVIEARGRRSTRRDSRRDTVRNRAVSSRPVVATGSRPSPAVRAHD